MYFKFRDFVHDANEVDLTMFQQEQVYSPRNKYVFLRKTMTIQGHFCVSGQSNIRSKLQALEEVYLSDLVASAGLYHDDGTPSAHFLDDKSSLNGVRVMALDYPKDEGGEYDTGRSYRIVLQADYLNPRLLESHIWSWEETISMHGAGGPSWEMIPQFVGPPVKQINAMLTPQRFIQSGQSVGVTMHVTPFNVLPPNGILFPEYEHGDRRIMEYGTTLKKGAYHSILFPSKWTFFYTLPPGSFTTGIEPFSR